MKTYFEKQAKNNVNFFILETTKNPKRKTVRLELQRVSLALADFTNFIFVRYTANGNIPVFKLNKE
jgi:hypothetical protein